MQTTNKEAPGKKGPTVDELLAAIAKGDAPIDTARDTQERPRSRLPRSRGLVGEGRARGRVPRRARRREGGAMTTLGTTTTYDGTSTPTCAATKVRIVAVLKNALRADYDPTGMGSTSAIYEDPSARAA